MDWLTKWSPRFVCIASSMILSVGNVTAQGTVVQQALDSLVKVHARTRSNWNASSQSGAVLITVVRDGAVIWRSATADSIDASIANPVFQQFIATGIFILQTKNLLKTSNSVRKYLKDLPSLYETVTIDQLIHHTSGTRDGFALAALAADLSKRPTSQEVYNLLRLQQSVNFKPGNDHEFNGSGYLLLAMVIEKASGNPLNDFLKKNVFVPLGMTQTMISSSAGSLILRSNLNDLSRWIGAMERPARVPALAKIIPLLLQTGKLADGTVIFSSGVIDKSLYRNRMVFSQGVADAGSPVRMLYFPMTKVGIIAGFSDDERNDSVDLLPLLLAVADLVNGEKPSMTVKNKAVKGDVVDGQLLSTGWYYNEEDCPELVYLKRYKDYGLINAVGDVSPARRFELHNDTLESEDLPPLRYIYRLPGIARVDRVTGKQRALTRVEILTDTIRSGKYIAAYYSPELKQTMRISSQKGQLSVELKNGNPIQLSRISLTEFRFDQNGINFIRFTDTDLYLSRRGCWRLKFSRVKQ